MPPRPRRCSRLDGTTTRNPAGLARLWLREALKNICSRCQPDGCQEEGIQKAVAAAVESIRADSKKVSGSADIERVATISAGDAAIGKLIAEAMEKVTHDGVITNRGIQDWLKPTARL